jgi:hypothetical protein
MDQTYLNSLTSREKVFYRATYEFHLRNFPGSSPESAHEAGVKDVEKLRRLSKEAAKPVKTVDLSTGKTFYTKGIF